MIEKRIYVILPKTVQSPLEVKERRKRIIRVATKQTKTTVQPVGRLGAQACHVTSKMRMARLIELALSIHDLDSLPMKHWLNSMLEMDGALGRTR